MNLTLHHFRKDLRQFRVLLLVWFAMLALDLATNLGWVNAVKTSGQPGDGSMANFMAGLQTFFLWVLFFMVPSVVVVADSPARREGFLRTRPLPGRDLFLAKTLFVLALVILPALVQEWIYLTVSGLPAGYVLHGVGERLLFAMPLVAIAAAFASLWRSYAQWVGGLALAYGGTLAVLLLVELILYLTGHLDENLGHSDAPMVSRYWGALLAFSLIALLVAVTHARYAWGPGRRWLGIAAAIFVFMSVLQYWPWNLFKKLPADPAAAQAVVNQVPLNVTLQDLSLVPVFGKQWDDRLDFEVWLNPPLNRSILPTVIEWNGHQTALINRQGQSFLPGHPPGNSPRRQPFSDPPAGDLAALTGLLPKDVIIRAGQMYGNIYPATLGEFKLDSHQNWLHDPVTLNADLAGDVYRWDKVADFPLNTKSVAKDAYGAWVFYRWGRDKDMQQSYLFVKRSQVSLATATDPRLTAFDSTPHERYEYVLYNPRRNVALIPINNYYGTTSVRASSSALEQYWLDLVFSDYGSDSWKPFTPEEMAQCRLLIFQKTWLGTVPVAWQSPGFVVNDLLTPLSSNVGAYQNGLSRGEIQRRLAEVPLPGPQASREDVCRYLLQALPIIDDGRYAQSPGEAVIAQLAALVPAHLEVLLDGLPAMGTASQNAVIAAIAGGAEESQKDRIIKALPANPGLINVLFWRGWMAGARAAIYKLMDSPKPLTFAAMQAIASFQDPKTYPSLLRGLKADPRSDTYDLLRPLPGMAEPLAACVNQIWAEQDPLVSNNMLNLQHPLSLAMHAGNPDALRFALRLLAETTPARSGGRVNNGDLAEIFRDNVQLDGVDWYDNQNWRQIMEKIRPYGPEAFVFDPVRQRFVLKH